VENTISVEEEETLVSSFDVGPGRKGKEHLDRALQEHYIMKEAVNL
jgi:hypothetical protein